MVGNVHRVFEFHGRLAIRSDICTYAFDVADRMTIEGNSWIERLSKTARSAIFTPFRERIGPIWSWFLIRKSFEKSIQYPVRLYDLSQFVLCKLDAVLMPDRLKFF